MAMNTIHKKFALSNSQELSQIISNKQDFPVLIAIDFEGPDKIMNCFQQNKENCQTGIYIFDTEQFLTESSPAKLKTASLICGTDNYYAENISRCQWGKIRRVEKSSLIHRISTVIPTGRKVVLVGHGVKTEIDCLRALMFDFTNISAFYDTYELAMQLNIGNLQLNQLIAKLGHDNYERGIFHTAVNDAVITLQCFLELYLLQNKSTHVLQSSASIVDGLKQMARVGIYEHQGRTYVHSDRTTYESRQEPVTMIDIPDNQRLSYQSSRSSSPVKKLPQQHQQYKQQVRKDNPVSSLPPQNSRTYHHQQYQQQQQQYQWQQQSIGVNPINDYNTYMYLCSQLQPYINEDPTTFLPFEWEHIASIQEQLRQFTVPF